MNAAVHVQAYLDHLAQRNMTPGTIYARRVFLTRIEGEVGAPLTTATEEQWTAWYASLTTRVKADTRGNYLAGVRSWYRWAVLYGVVEVDPTRRLPRPKKRKRLPRPISEHDLSLAIATATGRARLVLMLAAFAGLRAIEIARLRGEDISGEHLVVHGKGDKERIVELHPALRMELARCARTGPVIERHDGRDGHCQPWLVSQLGNKHLHSLDIPDTLHSLRHRFATGVYRRSHDLLMVASLLGHESTTTTQMYAAWHRPDATSAINSLPEVA